MIDMHIHAVGPNLPGVKPLAALLDEPPPTVAAVIREEMKQVGVTHVLAMGRLDCTAADPLGIQSTLAIAELVPGMAAIGVADPTQTDAAHLARVEEELQRGRVKALKGYLGYIYHGPDSPGYVPYFRLAARYNLPVIFHTGDNYSRKAKVRYAHPLLVDDVAVDHPGVRFVMAHFGNPWLTDAAEVVYKNDNVWVDFSALLVGDAATFAAYEQSGLMGRTVERVRQAMEFSERPDRWLYGSDWPLAPMAAYRDFIAALVPEPFHQALFEDNARALFGLG
jgi:predicted TIM-barrel fold metal-dependent hydrolase